MSLRIQVDPDSQLQPQTYDSAGTFAEVLDQQRSEAAWNRFLQEKEASTNEVLQLLRLLRRHGMQAQATLDRIRYTVKSLQSKDLNGQDQLAVLHLLVQLNMFDDADEFQNIYIRETDDQALLFQRVSIEALWIRNLIKSNYVDRALEVFRNYRHRQKDDEIAPQIYGALVEGFCYLHGRYPQELSHLQTALKFMGASGNVDVVPFIRAVFDDTATRLLHASGVENLQLARVKWGSTVKNAALDKLISDTISTAENLAKVVAMGEQDIEEMVKVIKGTRKVNTKDVIQYNIRVIEAFIQGYSRLGMLSQLEKWFQIMESQYPEEIKSNIEIWNQYLNAYGKVTQEDKEGSKLEKILYIYDKMNRFGLPVNINTKNIMLQAYGRTTCVNALVQQLEYFEEQFGFQGQHATSYSYSILVDSCMKTLSKLKHIEMLRNKNGLTQYGSFTEDQQKVYPKSISLKELYVKSRDPMLVVERLLELMKERDRAPTSITYTSILQGYVRHNQHEDAYNLFKGMKRARMPIDVRLGSAIMRGLCNSGLYTEALQVFESISHKRLDRKNSAAVVLTSLLKDNFILEECTPIAAGIIYAYGQMDRIDKAQEIFDNIPRNGHFRRNIMCYNAMLQGYKHQALNSVNKPDQVANSPQSALQAAFALLNSLKVENQEATASDGLQMYPTLFTYSLLMQISSLEGKYDLVLKFFTMILKDESVRIVPDYLVGGFLRCLNGDWNYSQKTPLCPLITFKTSFRALQLHPLNSTSPESGMSPITSLKVHSIYQYQYNSKSKLFIGPFSHYTYIKILKSRKDLVGMIESVKSLVEQRIKFGENLAMKLIDLFDPEQNTDTKSINDPEEQQAAVEFQEQLREEWIQLEKSFPDDYFDRLSSPAEVLPSADEFVNDF